MSVSSLEERLASQLHILASAAGKRETSDEESETYSLFVRQDDLANMLGVARQSINRILKEWEAVGLVKLTYGGLAVTDMPGLLKIAVPPGESGKSEAG
jgi:CRP-like cAMP-binding protein